MVLVKCLLLFFIPAASGVVKDVLRSLIIIPYLLSFDVSTLVLVMLFVIYNLPFIAEYFQNQ